VSPYGFNIEVKRPPAASVAVTRRPLTAGNVILVAAMAVDCSAAAP
jgi:hypothetical protein